MDPNLRIPSAHWVTPATQDQIGPEQLDILYSGIKYRCQKTHLDQQDKYDLWEIFDHILNQLTKPLEDVNLKSMCRDVLPEVRKIKDLSPKLFEILNKIEYACEDKISSMSTDLILQISSKLPSIEFRHKFPCLSKQFNTMMEQRFRPNSLGRTLLSNMKSYPSNGYFSRESLKLEPDFVIGEKSLKNEECCNADLAIAYIIKDAVENGSKSVDVNLLDFKDVTNEHIKTLFEQAEANGFVIKSLMISSPFINDLPEACKTLEVLFMIDCSVETIPKYLINLEHLLVENTIKKEGSLYFFGDKFPKLRQCAFINTIIVFAWKYPKLEFIEASGGHLSPMVCTRFPNLTHIKLKNGNKIYNCLGWASNFRNVHIEKGSSFTHLHKFFFREQAASQLQKLTIKDCLKLVNIDTKLTALNHLEVTGCDHLKKIDIDRENIQFLNINCKLLPKETKPAPKNENCAIQ